MKSNFFAELIARLFSGKPEFFSTLQKVAAIIAVISFAFDKATESGIILPEWMAMIGTSAVWIGSVIAAIIAQLPVKDKK